MKKIAKSKEVKSITQLITGTSIAQLIPLLISPILSRLYNENEFGHYSTFYSCVVILTVLNTGRLELALFIPKEPKTLKSIFKTQVYFTIASSIVIFAIVSTIIIFVPKNENLAFLDFQFWTVVSLTALFTGIGNGIAYYTNRISEFKSLAQAKVARSSSKASSSLLFGFVKLSSVGLNFSELISSIVYFSFLSVKSKIFLGLKLMPTKHSLFEAKSTLIRYKNFIKYSVPSGVMENVSAYMPALLVPLYFGFNYLGLFAFAQRIINFPSTLISQAFGEVFKQKFSDRYSKGEACLPLFYRTIKRLLLIAAPGYFILYIIAPEFFILVFGDNWEFSGVLTRYMIPMIILQFIVSPLSSVLLITERQKIDLYFQLVLTPLIFISLLVGKYSNDFGLAIQLYSAVYAIKYIVEIIITYRIINKYERTRI